MTLMLQRIGRLFGATYLGVFCLSATAALGADFTITVPVRLNNMPPGISTFAIFCNVYIERGASLDATAQREIRFTGSSYAGDVVMEVNARRPENRHLATHYYCNIADLAGRDAGGVWRSYPPSSVAGGHPERFIPLQEGAPFVWETRQRFP